MEMKMEMADKPFVLAFFSGTQRQIKAAKTADCQGRKEGSNQLAEQKLKKPRGMF